MARGPVGDNIMTRLLLRVWLWAVPIVMFGTALVFGGIAAADGSWGLTGAMFVLGLIAIGMMVMHYWLLYRFGKEPPR